MKGDSHGQNVRKHRILEAGETDCNPASYRALSCGGDNRHRNRGPYGPIGHIVAEGGKRSGL